MCIQVMIFPAFWFPGNSSAATVIQFLRAAHCRIEVYADAFLDIYGRFPNLRIQFQTAG